MSEVIEEDGSGSPSTIEAIEETIEDNKEVKEVKKRGVAKPPPKPYVLSPLRLEALAKAREKAFSLRKEFHDNKEPIGKKEKIKKKSKLEIELENRELRASHSHLQKAVALTRPQVEEKVGGGTPPVVEGDGSGSPPVESGTPPVVEKVIEKVIEKVPVGDYTEGKRSPSTRPSFIKNENGFFCI
jgi:hypothetical protein